MAIAIRQQRACSQHNGQTPNHATKVALLQAAREQAARTVLHNELYEMVEIDESSPESESPDPAPDPADLEARLRRREAGEPLAWIVGGAGFAGHRVRVDPGVYVPRRQTEHLAVRAAAALAPAGRAADLCTGAGAVVLRRTAG